MASRVDLTAPSWLAQIRRKGDNENLAEWVVDITTEADRQGSDIFVTTFQKCAALCMLRVQCPCEGAGACWRCWHSSLL